MDKLRFAYLMTLCTHAKARCLTSFPSVGQWLHWGLADPAAEEGSEEEQRLGFRTVHDALDARIQAWLAEMDSA